MSRWTRVVGAGLLLIVVGGVGCAADKAIDDGGEVTTTAPGRGPEIMEPEPAPSADAVVKALETAAAGDDFCSLIDAFNLALPDAADPAGAIRVYDALAAAAREARRIVPSELESTWPEMELGTEEGAAAVRSADGDLNDSRVRAVFQTTTMRRVSEAVERYQYKTCSRR